MCNFIIRPIKSYATVDVLVPDILSEHQAVLKQGSVFEVISVSSDGVLGKTDHDEEFTIPLSLFVHTFSDKDPNKKEEKKDSKKESK